MHPSSLGLFPDPTPVPIAVELGCESPWKRFSWLCGCLVGSHRRAFSGHRSLPRTHPELFPS